MNAKTPALWQSATRREATQLVKRLWPELSADDRSRLLHAILEGPPRALYRANLTEEQWKELRDSEIWRWLYLIRHSSADQLLLPEGEEELARLEALHPDWQLPDWQAEGFVSWSFGAGFVGQPSEITAQELLAKTIEQIVAMYTDGRPEVSADAWRQATAQNPKQTAAALTELAKKQRYPEEAWKGALQALPRFDSGDFCGLLDALVHAPEETIARVCRQFAMWLSIRASDLTQEDEKHLWPVWVKLAGVAENERVSSGEDNPRQAAINHPYGNLAEVLVRRLSANRPQANQGLGYLTKKFDVVAKSAGVAGWCGRVILASAVNLLFWVDSTWTIDNLLPRFDWDHSDEAAKVWDGFLASAQLGISLFLHLKPYFLESFRRMGGLNNWGNLCELLAAIGLEGSDELSADEARNAIRIMGADGRHRLTFWIARRMKPHKASPPDAAEQQEEKSDKDSRIHFFERRVIPWLTSAWPPETGSVDGSVAANIAIASIWAGSAYPRAVEKLGSFWVKTDQADRLLHELDESKQSERFPRETLDLLSRLLKDPLPSWTAQQLQTVLTQVKKVGGNITQDPRYVSLCDAVLRAGSF